MIKRLAERIIESMLIAMFYLAIWLSAFAENVKEFYYIVFRIPYYKGKGKFHKYVVRKSSVHREDVK